MIVQIRLTREHNDIWRWSLWSWKQDTHDPHGEWELEHSSNSDRLKYNNAMDAFQAASKWCMNRGYVLA